MFTFVRLNCGTSESVIFHVERHPQFPWFQQCVTFNFFPTPDHELAYNLFSIIALYGLPLFIITSAYCVILCRISKKSRQSKGEVSARMYDDGGCEHARLRRSGIGNIERAKLRTLRMTCVIVGAYVLCWTPYFVITSWYSFDRESALKVDSRVQRGLFIFAVSNSCINPIVYGIKVGGQNINNLRYADDTVLIAENKEDLQKFLNIVEEESRKKGLELNSKKTEVMVISRKQESPKCDIFINKVKLKQTEKFKYLGTIISNDGKTNREISARTAQAKINFQKMKTILTNKHISIETRKRALQCYIEPVLMYGCEAWTISKQIQNRLEAIEIWFLRRMLRIPWTAKKTNERVLNEANKRRSLVRTIKKRQATFLGHVMRRGKLEHLVTTGKFERKRSRGRQREKIMDGLATWLGPGKVSDILAAVKDRDMIANAYKQGT
ncbi:gonadotropin-releasing hormone receptor [Plakobranchus ocellatus]|uniref:Gonadotropin-releasing hormone receptor n=1 Tax=Plakobranchus ocellatus TaxID=259542 RepID=A0AAV4B5A5_9GAST|nr:gonadotropin-releasing hormone receptor [Plakobranchus ocellatus]